KCNSGTLEKDRAPSARGGAASEMRRTSEIHRSVDGVDVSSEPLDCACGQPWYSRNEAAIMSKSLRRTTYPGKLIIVEGIDGSGKSTQLDLLRKWLMSQNYLVAFSEWNSSPMVNRITKRGKK